MDNQTQTYTILKNFERKVEALECSSCMLALTMMSMSLAVDARRLTKYFLIMLDGWRKCLPLGDACDVNFTTWAGVQESSGGSRRKWRVDEGSDDDFRQ